MLLQTNSVINSETIKAPWEIFEFDACFRTMAPLEGTTKKGEANVAGAFKNVISAERMFLKSYIQLWQSQDDPAVRSHVFSYDRPCYHEFDKYGELVLWHHDGSIEEKIEPMIHFDKESDISHLVMSILTSMAQEAIPEAIGHNYPLFIADKKAKSTLQQAKTSYLSAVAAEMAKSDLDQQVLFEAKFRDYRSDVESRRK